MWLFIPSRFAPDLPASNSESTLRALEHSSRSCTLNTKLPSPKSLRLALQNGRFRRLQFGLTSEQSAMNQFANTFADEQASKESDCSRPDTLAPHFRSPASVAARTIQDTYGPGLWTRLIAIARRCASLKTSQVIFQWDSEPCEEILKSEATQFRRAYSRRLRLALRTSDSGSSSSPWMTPHGMGTTDATGKLSAGGEFAKQATNWPTPDAALMNNREQPESFEARRKKLAQKHRNGNGAGTPLGMAVLQWPTPRSEDAESCGNHPEAINSLTGATKLWATPQAERVTWRQDTPLTSGGGNRSLGLDIANFPTPKSSDTRSGSVSQATLAKNSRPLCEVVCRLGHQPETPPKDGEDCSQTSRNSRRQSPKLNFLFVEWLMGYPKFWTGTAACEHSEIQSYRSRSRQLLSSYLQRISREKGETVNHDERLSSDD